MSIFDGRPIPKDGAISRLHRSGVALAEAVQMSDTDLLRLPLVGRRTLRWVRAFQPVET